MASPRMSQGSPRSSPSRPFTVHQFAHVQSPRNAALIGNGMNAGFGSVQDRYKSMQSHCSSQTSSYFKERAAAIAHSTVRERSGASGNTPRAVAGYSQNGAPMRGVTAFPFEKQQAAYVEDFAAVVASQLIHPYQSITENNADSTQYNIITGSAWQKGGELGSTYKRDFSRGVGGRPFGSKDPGLRSEEMITVGQFTAVPGLRSWAGSS